MDIKLASLAEAKKELLKLSENQEKKPEGWSIYKTFVHCAKTIDYSIAGYPSLKPAVVRNTIGRLAIHKFLKQGYMKHDLQADVPGSPDIVDDGTFQAGVKILFDSIEKFQTYKGELKPHLLFGTMDKEAYDKYFAMHIADHLSSFSK
jgi:hypothetical protein